MLLRPSVKYTEQKDAATMLNIVSLTHSICVTNLNTTDFEWRNKLRYVRIYFDTPTLDIVTNDRYSIGVQYMCTV